MKRFITLFALVPMVSFGQWNQKGNSINGAANDKLGSTHAVAIDSLGTTIAVGSAYNSDVFPYSGYARVLDWNGTSWIQRGSNFVGENATFEGTGSAVDLSADGLTVAVSSPWGYNSLGYKCGNVRVYDWISSTWVQRGSTIDGEGNSNPLYEGDVFGTALQLSADGNFLVVGARANTPQIGLNNFTGHVRVYNWNGSSWAQIGQDIDGPVSFGSSEFGYAVSISDLGDRIAIGARSFTGSVSSNQERGMAIALEFNGTDWTQMGDTIFGSAGNNTGAAVQLSSDGNTMAVGAPKANSFLGITKVFDWNGTDWVQRGSDISGINGAQSGISIGMSNNGNILAIGEPWTNSALGSTRMFKWNGSNWLQFGNTLSPSGSNVEAFGSAVRLNASGSRVIVGIPFNDAAGNNAGKVNVYENVSDASVSSLSDIPSAMAYPNPIDQLVQVTCAHEILSYSLISLEGKIIETKTSVQANELMLDFSDIKAGVYMLTLQSSDKTTTLKLIKK